ncbi:hypothetical protein CH063_13252 [Colletotrichum higginsianum]|uniref:Uncharacterized protein n=1 Tax=Colletotrichum higginsianum (strain IMI 349063) TaxID=759273 RepID=H1VTN8_COLHI|nr:hypothetical protein CH063_07001 [Colletotrichum higginsianum]CCF43596.1 hypothetical protein CH063_13252 [Colletotrichum higginsianum]
MLSLVKSKFTLNHATQTVKSNLTIYTYIKVVSAGHVDSYTVTVNHAQERTGRHLRVPFVEVTRKRLLASLCT